MRDIVGGFGGRRSLGEDIPDFCVYAKKVIVGILWGGSVTLEGIF